MKVYPSDEIASLFGPDVRSQAEPIDASRSRSASAERKIQTDVADEALPSIGNGIPKAKSAGPSAENRQSRVLLALLTVLFLAVPVVADAATKGRNAAEIKSTRQQQIMRMSNSNSFATQRSSNQPGSTFGYGVGDNSHNQTW